MRYTSCLFLIACFGFTVGCNQAKQSTSSVAVVDLDKVAADLGRETLIVAAVKEHEARINQQLSDAKASYESQLRATQAKFGEQASPEQAQQLVNLQSQANKQLQTAASQAQGKLQQHRTKLLLEFREEARTAAKQIAEEQGLSLVVTKNDSVVLVYNNAVDITAAVTQRLRATGRNNQSLGHTSPQVQGGSQSSLLTQR